MYRNSALRSLDDGCVERSFSGRHHCGGMSYGHCGERCLADRAPGHYLMSATTQGRVPTPGTPRRELRCDCREHPGCWDAHADNYTWPEEFDLLDEEPLASRPEFAGRWERRRVACHVRKPNESISQKDVGGWHGGQELTEDAPRGRKAADLPVDDPPVRLECRLVIADDQDTVLGRRGELVEYPKASGLYFIPGQDMKKPRSTREELRIGAPLVNRVDSRGEVVAELFCEYCSKNFHGVVRHP